MKATRLRTEFLNAPIGIDIKRPRLFWNTEGGVWQSAYEIEAEAEDGTILWKSGKVISSAMRTEWGGLPIPPETRIIWRIRLWDESEQCGEWSESFFESGIGEWKAKWITGDYRAKRKNRYPVDSFRKIITLSKVRRARLYATACGLYEARINGERVGDSVLTPGITDYRKLVQYQTYDVTELLKEGENEITVDLSDGWYRGSCGAWGLRNQYGSVTKVMMQLELYYNDGRRETVATDGSWSWSNDGPIRSADIQDGEEVDASFSPSYSGRARVTRHSVVPTGSNNVPVREHERLKPRLITAPSGKSVLDFAQNIAGYVEFSLKAKKGDEIYLRFGELLDENGEFTQKNIQCSSKKKTTPLQEVRYKAKDGENTYKTRFAIFGFQYILLDTTVSFSPEDFTAIAVYSDMERTGWFTSSNALLDKLVENTVWSAKNNHADLPTDCPTRERHGWTGDAEIFTPTASFLFDYASFARKYERDLVMAQKRNGCYPQIVPEGGIDFYMRNMDGSAGWSDAGVFIPYEIYRRYGDRAILEDNYQSMARYAAFKKRTLGKWYLTSRPTGAKGKDKKWISNYGQSYGEWAEPVDVKAFSISDFISPHPEETTAYIVLLMDRMAEIADILGKKDDATVYRETAENVRRGYRCLVRSPKFSLDTDRQAKLVRPLYIKILEGEDKRYAGKRLLKALDNYSWRLGTGFLSTPLILHVLSEMGTEYAYRLLENEDIPGWLSMPKNGATTIWESWEGPNAQGGVASLNHYSKGAVVEWLFSSMCGINVEGENSFVIKPLPGGHFTHATAIYDSIYGRVESGWRREKNEWIFSVVIPSNCRATIVLPNGEKSEQGPGRKEYRTKVKGGDHV